MGSASCSWVMGPHQLDWWWHGPPPNGRGPCSSSGLCFLFMGDGPPPNGGAHAAQVGSSCFLFMGDGPHQLDWWGPGPPPNGGAHAAQVGSASCSWVMGLHQLVGVHAAQVGSAPCSWVMGPHQLVGALDFTSCVAWTTTWSKFQPITTNLFSFSEKVLKLSSAMKNSNNFPEAIPWTPVLVERKGGEREVCFCSPKMYWNYPTTMQNTNFFRGLHH